MSYISAEHVLASMLRARPERDAGMPPRLVVVYERPLFEAARAALEAEPKPDWIYADRPMRRLHVSRRHPDVALLNIEIGAPLVAFLLELFAACGLREVLVVSSGGAVAPGPPIGSLFTVESARSRNGVTLDLAPDRREFGPSEAAAASLERARAAAGVPARPVRTLSCDAFFRAAPGFWLDRDGAAPPDIVEMEAATVFAVAERTGLDAAVIGYISDVLGESWERSREQYYPSDRLRLVDVLRRYAELPAARDRVSPS